MQTDPDDTDKPANLAEDLDSEFDNESLGDRQPEACSMDDGCQTCQ